MPDTTTRKGRDAIKALAFKVTRSKTALDEAGKQLNAGLRRQIDTVDVERRKVRERFDALKDEVRQPLNAWEAAEDERIARHKDRIDEAFRLAGDDILVGDIAGMKRTLATVKETAVDASFEEFEMEAHRAKAKAIADLEKLIAEQERIAAERAELEKLRAEAAARAAEDERRAKAEAAEAKRIAAEKAEAERQARIHLENEEAAAKAVARVEQARREAAEAERARALAEQERRDQEAATREAELKRQAEEAKARELRAAQAERDHIAAEQKAAAEAQAKREASTRIRKRVLNEIAAALIATNDAIRPHTAHVLADALADGKIPHCKVTF